MSTSSSTCPPIDLTSLLGPEPATGTPAPASQRGGRLGEGIDVLIDEVTLARRVAALGAQIGRDFANRQLCAVAILRGGFMFFADLVRAIDLPLTCEFMGVSSYGEATCSSGQVKVTQPLGRPVAGQHVLIVEDIVDTGLSMRSIMDTFADAGAASVSACALLSKPAKQAVALQLRYVGFQIPDHFVVGYGLDDRGLLRNLPFVGVRR